MPLPTVQQRALASWPINQYTLTLARTAGHILVIRWQFHSYR
jgi:hypothetical protein